MNVILEPMKLNAIASDLKLESMDYYLFFMCLYRSGYTGAKLLKLCARDVPDFIRVNEPFLGGQLIDELNNHIRDKNAYEPLFCNKFSNNPLPRRTFEYWLIDLGKKHLDNQALGFTQLIRTFYYEYFQKCGYEYEPVRLLFKERKQYMPTLEAFLEYCGMTEQEYLADKAKHQRLNGQDYISNSKEIIALLCDVMTAKDVSVTLGNEYTEKTTRVLEILRPLRNL